jgi:hypothetical protein
MRIAHSRILVPKMGHEAIGSDDAADATVPKGGQITVTPARVAIADGASGSLHAGLWAEILVKWFCGGRIAIDARKWPTARLARRWKAETHSRLAKQYKDGLPWYLESKLDQPAQAAFVGLEVSSGMDQVQGTYQAIGAGDSCLIHVHHDRVLTTWPLSNPESFDNDPELIAASAHEEPAKRLKYVSGNLESGDRLYLLTDAIAAWFLRNADTGAEILDRHLSDPEAFRKWLATQRQEQAIKNDDVTIVRLAFES